MPKSLFVDPKKVRKAEILKIKDIPVNQYQSNFEKELKTYGADELKRILYDMQTIRAFETMLNTFKRVLLTFRWDRKPPRSVSASTWE